MSKSNVLAAIHDLKTSLNNHFLSTQMLLHQFITSMDTHLAHLESTIPTIPKSDSLFQPVAQPLLPSASHAPPPTLSSHSPHLPSSPPTPSASASIPSLLPYPLLLQQTEHSQPLPPTTLPPPIPSPPTEPPPEFTPPAATPPSISPSPTDPQPPVLSSQIPHLFSSLPIPSFTMPSPQPFKVVPLHSIVPPFPQPPSSTVDSRPPTLPPPSVLSLFLPTPQLHPAEIKEKSDWGLGSRLLLLVGSEDEIVSDAFGPRSATIADASTVGVISNCHTFTVAIVVLAVAGHKVQLCGEPPPETFLQLQTMTSDDSINGIFEIDIWPASIDVIFMLGLNTSRQIEMISADQSHQMRVCLVSATLGPVTHHYDEQCMEFMRGGQKTQLRSDVSEMPLFSFHQNRVWASLDEGDQNFEPNAFFPLRPNPLVVGNSDMSSIAFPSAAAAGDLPCHFPYPHLEDKVNVKKWGMIHPQPKPK